MATSPGEYTAGEAIDKFGCSIFQFLLWAVISINFMGQGMTIMTIGMLGAIIDCDWNLTSGQQALIDMSMFIGAFLSSIPWGFLADFNGRQGVLSISTSLYAYYGVLSCLAPNYAWLIALRILSGMGYATIPIILIYFIEMTTSSTRGIGTCVICFFWALGSALSPLSAMFLVDSYNWRYWLLACYTPIIISAPFFYFLPGSPRFLSSVGELEKSKAALNTLAKCNKTNLPEGTLVQDETEVEGKWSALFGRKLWLPLVLSAYISFVAMTTYCSVPLLTTQLLLSGSSCSEDIHQFADVSGVKSCVMDCKKLSQQDYMDLFLNALAEMPALIMTMYLLERVGRRVSLISLLFLVGVAYIPLLFCLSRTLVLVILFIQRFLTTSLGTIFWLYFAELFPTQLRNIATTYIDTFIKIGAIASPILSQMLFTASYEASIISFAALAFIGGIACLALKVETSGISLEEIQRLSKSQ